MAGEITWSLIFQVAQFVVTGGIGTYLYMERKNDRTNVRIAQLEQNTDTRLDELAERMARVEGELHNGIGKHDLERVHGRIDALDQRLARVEGEFRSVSDLLRLILSKIADKGMS